MGKLGKKHGNTLQGGTVVQDGMRVWVDGRQMKGVTIRTGDKCKHLAKITFMISDAFSYTVSTYRIIFEDTREMTCKFVKTFPLMRLSLTLPPPADLWTGDISIDRVQS